MPLYLFRSPPFLVLLVQTALAAYNRLLSIRLPFASAMDDMERASAYVQTVALHSPEQLNRFVVANPMLFMMDPGETESVHLVATQIQRGIIPGLIEMAREFPPDPDLPQARQLLNRFTYFLGQAGELGEMRGEQLRLALGLRSRKNALQQLKMASQRYEFHVAKSRVLTERIHYLNQVIVETENALIPLLATDPSLGESIHVNFQNRAYPDWMQKLLRWLEKNRRLKALDSELINSYSL